MEYRSRRRPAERVRAMFSPPTAMSDDLAGHMYVIDLFRGLAALSVLVWHYQHFFFLLPGQMPDGDLRQRQPFYDMLSPLYERGFYAVQLFWMISGFVFCAVYARRNISTRAFAVNRVARLYPLHLLTLLVVALLQVVSMNAVGHWQIYQHNDARHFVLQLFMASNWGLQEGESFNGPIWSISVEIVIYALFWMSRGFLYRQGIAGPAVVAVACFLINRVPGVAGAQFWECGFYFFAGTAIRLIFSQMRDLPWPMLIAGLFAIAIGRWLGGLPVAGLENAAKALLITGITLFACALETPLLARAARRLTWIGDNTYGCYLWHIPIQIVALILLDHYAIGRDIALNPLFFIGFVALVMIVSRLSFLWFEKPMRRTIRAQLEVRRPRKALSAS